MDKLTNWVEQAVVPKVSRITSLRYFQALRNGFCNYAVNNYWIDFYVDYRFSSSRVWRFMAGIFGADWADMISPAYRATFNMMGIIFAGTMSYKLAESYEMDRLTSLILELLLRSRFTENGDH